MEVIIDELKTNVKSMFPSEFEAKILIEAIHNICLFLKEVADVWNEVFTLCMRL